MNMYQRLKNNYDLVDACKFFACICIVCIHTAAFSDLIGGVLLSHNMRF